MKITYSFHDINVLKSDSPGYSYGWLQIESRASEVALFKDKQCMLFTTADFLHEHLITLSTTNTKQIRWVGEGYGAVLELVKAEDMLMIKGDDIHVLVKFQDFKSELIRSTKEFLSLCRQMNPEIVKDSGFQTLESGFHNLEKS